MTDPKIHPTAILGDEVAIGPDTEIGPYCIIEDKVTIGSGNRLLAHVYLGRNTVIGDHNRFFPYASAGLVPQDLKFRDEETRTEIGNHNNIREHVTIHRGTGHGGGVTKLGNHNLVMVNAHMGHDAIVGDRNILAHGATLAGHVTVGSDTTVGSYSGVHQFCRVGDHAFIGGFSVVVKDALPYIKTVGNHAKIYGINTIGLERKEFSKEEIQTLQQAYRILFLRKLRLVEALEKLETELADQPRVRYLIDFIKSSDRGITR